MKKTFHLIVTTIIFFLCTLSTTIEAQQNNTDINSNASYAEKIYLQLDKSAYATETTIWFKAIVTDAITHAPTTLSKILYAELIDQDKKVLAKKLIKIENGIGQGFFDLDKELKKGSYLVRAYTQWNKNFGSDFIFEQYIYLFHIDQKKEPITNLTLLKDPTKTNRLQASIDPLLIDPEHKRKLTVFVKLNDQKDTLTLKKMDDGKYFIDYPLESDSEYATLEIQTQNEKTYSKTFILNKEYVDLQFFPESGELVHGLNNKIGFKAVNPNGKGKIVQGEIIDEQGTSVASFRSNILGMGSFIIKGVQDGKSYHARLFNSLSKEESKRYPLPKVASKGNILSMSRNDNSILLTVASNYLKNDNMLLRISHRGTIQYLKNISLKNGTYTLLIPNKLLPEGIISGVLMNSNKQPVAERLYFNQRPEKRINIDITTNKEIYSKRESTRLDIQATDSVGKPINANLSLLVINKEQLGKSQSLRQNILSYYLLDSELRGKIENPGFYFNSPRDIQYHLDVLMLTQGWRKYHYAKPLGKLLYKPEKNLSITGVIKRNPYRKTKKVNISMMTFGKSGNIYSKEIGTFNNFQFDLDDEYGDQIGVTIQTTGEKGKKERYPVTLQKEKSPPINFNHYKSIETVNDSTFQTFIEKEIVYDKVLKNFSERFDNQLLDEVVLSNYKLTPNRKKVMEKWGKPDLVIDGKELVEKIQKWSYGIYSIIEFNYPEKITIHHSLPDLIIENHKSSSPDPAHVSAFFERQIRFGKVRFPKPFAKIKGSDMTLVVIDGIPVKYIVEYPDIASIPTKAIKSFELIRCSKNRSIWEEATFRGTPYKGSFCMGIIAIYTHAGKGLAGTKTPKGITYTSMPVFSSPREFYTPKYDNKNINDSSPDLRSLVEWKPILKTDRLGKVTTSYYNADNIGKMKIVIEAISKNGEIGYKEIGYKVE